MLKILIPVDFSDNTKNVCKYAVNLINTEDTDIHIFHILPDGVMVPDSSFPAGIDSDAFLNSEYLEIMRQTANENMSKLLDFVKLLLKNSNFPNVNISSSILSGDAEWEIMNICESFNPTFVVMGTQGHGNKSLLQGSMAKKIMKKVKFPVIAVPENSKISIPKNILYATNFSELDYEKIILIFTLFHNLDITIYVTHFNIESDYSTAQKKMESLKQAFKKKRSDGKIHFNIIDSKNKSISLNTFCDQYDIDTISFISYKSNIFHYLFNNEIHKKDLFMLDMPMLALHE